MELKIKAYQLEVPENCNLILGQSHFIKLWKIFMNQL